MSDFLAAAVANLAIATAHAREDFKKELKAALDRALPAQWPTHGGSTVASDASDYPDRAGTIPQVKLDPGDLATAWDKAVRFWREDVDADRRTVGGLRPCPLDHFVTDDEAVTPGSVPTAADQRTEPGIGCQADPEPRVLDDGGGHLGNVFASLGRMRQWSGIVRYGLRHRIPA
ncbi:hypothetical protein [Mesorhizobium sp. GbtcB19]|uniref:hypothetical protein n=1 Tax=Mesorhizobium sp. GbtcB19 TaxID=2824764 RepID=UPI001C30CE85|nr:hypothetical protein [Mesorhizobium sp. GbtcB19]